jgi:hypothetical protein
VWACCKWHSLMELSQPGMCCSCSSLCKLSSCLRETAWPWVSPPAHGTHGSVPSSTGSPDYRRTAQIHFTKRGSSDAAANLELEQVAHHSQPSRPPQGLAAVLCLFCLHLPSMVASGIAAGRAKAVVITRRSTGSLLQQTYDGCLPGIKLGVNLPPGIVCIYPSIERCSMLTAHRQQIKLGNETGFGPSS